MDKTEFIGQLHQDLERDPALLRACESVVAYLAGQPAGALEHISFGMLSRAAGLPQAVDALPVAQYLASSRAQLLHRSFLLVVGDEEFEMSDDEVDDAFRDQVLYHPNLGEPVKDFEKALHVYFTVSESGKTILGQAT